MFRIWLRCRPSALRVIALGLTCARSAELKDDRFQLVRAEVRINHLNKSATYKIIESTSVIPCSIKKRRDPLLIWRHVQVTVRANHVSRIRSNLA
jgi:hypothetical protein